MQSREVALWVLFVRLPLQADFAWVSVLLSSPAKQRSRRRSVLEVDLRVVAIC